MAIAIIETTDGSKEIEMLGHQWGRKINTRCFISAKQVQKFIYTRRAFLHHSFAGPDCIHNWRCVPGRAMRFYFHTAMRSNYIWRVKKCLSDGTTISSFFQVFTTSAINFLFIYISTVVEHSIQFQFPGWQFRLKMNSRRTLSQRCLVTPALHTSSLLPIGKRKRDYARHVSNVLAAHF